MAINPKVGTWSDFLAFLHRAGEFGIRHKQQQRWLKCIPEDFHGLPLESGEATRQSTGQRIGNTEKNYGWEKL